MAWFLWLTYHDLFSRAYLFSAFLRRCAMRGGLDGEGGDAAIIVGRNVVVRV